MSSVIDRYVLPHWSLKIYSIPLQVNPSPSKVLGVFGLSVHTTEDQVHQIFSKFGPIRMKLVYDTKTGRSRGFCFVYYESTEDARVAKDNCTGMEIDGKRIRVDFSLTARPHSPTPGVYMGRSTRDHGDEPDRRRPMERDRLDYHNKSSKYTSHRSSAVFGRRRSPSPQYRRRRNRSDSRSPRIRTRKENINCYRSNRNR